MRLGLLELSFGTSPFAWVGDRFSASPGCCARSLKKLSSGDSELGEGIVGGLAASVSGTSALFSFGEFPRQQSASGIDYPSAVKAPTRAARLLFTDATEIDECVRMSFARAAGGSSGKAERE